MVDMIQTSCDYRSKLDKAMTAFSLFIHDLCPDARMEVSFVRYEDEEPISGLRCLLFFLRKSVRLLPTV
jgi:hypothetical protein